MFWKRAFIHNWWVGTKGEKLKFVDILSKECITNECIVVGQINTPFHDMETSRNPVVKVTKRGLYTASGRFYPFATAHQLYLTYLKELHGNGPVCIAFNWKEKKDDENKVEADVLFPDGTYTENVSFDYLALTPSKTKVYGFSETLQLPIVFHPFDRKAVRPEYQGWISMIEVNDLANEHSENSRALVKEISKLVKKAK